MTSDDRVKYTRAVFTEFVQAHRSRIFSSAEFDLVRRWIDKGYSLASVLQGVRETGGKPRTLHACENSVEAQAGRLAQALPTAQPVAAPDSWDAAAEKRRIMEKYGRRMNE